MKATPVSKFYLPATGPDDWKRLLAEPDKHWKDVYSAKSFAYAWQRANDFPPAVRKVFGSSGIPVFQDTELLLALPEYKVPLPGGVRPSQNDIFVLARGNDQLITIMVEGKVSESFGPTVAVWKSDFREGKRTRLDFLCELLEIPSSGIDHIRYQLLHRTASAVIEARRFSAPNALMLVHSFSKTDESFTDYAGFVGLYGLVGVMPGSLVYVKNLDGVNLYCAWVKD